MGDKHNSKELLASLPGSARGESGKAVDNFSLMPGTARVAPGHNAPEAKKKAAPPPHQLGSGSKIPESQETRMRSQFISPDPALYDRKRSNYAARQDVAGGSGLSGSSLPCGVYKSTPAATPAGGKESPRAAEARLKQENAMKRQQAAEAKQLMGQKEAILSNICATGQPGSSDVYRAMNIVGQINQKLGLPYNHTGSWVLPREW